MELLQILPVPLLLVITIAANLAANVTKKQYGSPACGGKDSAYIYSAVTSAICAVLMVAFAGFRISMSWYTLVLGLLYGVCTMLATVLLTKAMTIGPMSYSMVINSASTVITALSGFFFWNESLGALKIAGLVLMAGCFVFSVKKDDSGKRASLLWLVITLFSAVAGAGGRTLAEDPSKLGLPWRTDGLSRDRLCVFLCRLYGPVSVAQARLPLFRPHRIGAKAGG